MLTPSALLRGRPLSEKQFSQQVVDLARALGWRVYRTWLSIRSPAGFPDLVLVRQRPPRILFVELKSDTGKTTPDQEAWLEDLREVASRCEPTVTPWIDPVDVRVWRPADWDVIVATLQPRGSS